MKKLLLILIFLFVSTEAKSKYIALECEVKQTIYKIYDVKGRFIKNILDTTPSKTDLIIVFSLVAMSIPLLTVSTPLKTGCGFFPKFFIITPFSRGQGSAPLLFVNPSVRFASGVDL